MLQFSNINVQVITTMPFAFCELVKERCGSNVIHVHVQVHVSPCICFSRGGGEASESPQPSEGGVRQAPEPFVRG